MNLSHRDEICTSSNWNQPDQIRINSNHPTHIKYNTYEYTRRKRVHLAPVNCLEWLEYLQHHTHSIYSSSSTHFITINHSIKTTKRQIVRYALDMNKWASPKNSLHYTNEKINQGTVRSSAFSAFVYNTHTDTDTHNSQCWSVAIESSWFWQMCFSATLVRVLSSLYNMPHTGGLDNEHCVVNVK